MEITGDNDTYDSSALKDTANDPNPTGSDDNFLATDPIGEPGNDERASE